METFVQMGTAPKGPKPRPEITGYTHLEQTSKVTCQKEYDEDLPLVPIDVTLFRHRASVDGTKLR